jgi:hypothetical protein
VRLQGGSTAHTGDVVDRGDAPVTGDPRPDEPEALREGAAPRARTRLGFGWVAMILVVFAAVSLVFLLRAAL